MKVNELILELIKTQPDMEIDFYELDNGIEINLGEVTDVVRTGDSVKITLGECQ